MLLFDSLCQHFKFQSNLKSVRAYVQVFLVLRKILLFSRVVVVVKKRFLGHHQKFEKVPLKSTDKNKF